MCTLDIMGYASEQYFTIPFLVLLKALTKFSDAKQAQSEVNQRMLRQIEETCQNIIKHSKTFREDLFDKIVNFTFEGGCELKDYFVP